jgi:ABC-2 type transport system ATP-binding protein
MIHIQKLDFSYKKQPPLFANLNMELNTGSITGLLGKNGAGKTTLLKLIVGLQLPQSGKIEVLAHKPIDRYPSFLQNVFMVPEEFHLPSLTIKNFVKANSGFYPLFDIELMDRLLDEFELIAGKSINKMSYGQKKKFLISFALATKCRLMVLDEPTNGLDIPSKSIFRKVMAGSLDEDQLVVISTHQVKDVENLIDKIIILDNGRVILQKDLMEISSELQFAHSSVPSGDNVLYSEAVPGGYKIITPNSSGDSSVDIELLFNAVTKGTKLFSNYETYAN